jgi:hypothetical protein
MEKGRTGQGNEGAPGSKSRMDARESTWGDLEHAMDEGIICAPHIPWLPGHADDQAEDG